MTRATRSVTIRSSLIFQFRFILDGLKDVVGFNASIVALIPNLPSGAGRRSHIFYSVFKLYERFNFLLNLNEAMEGLDETYDGLFGMSSRGERHDPGPDRADSAGRERAQRGALGGFLT